MKRFYLWIISPQGYSMSNICRLDWVHTNSVYSGMSFPALWFRQLQTKMSLNSTVTIILNDCHRCSRGFFCLSNTSFMSAHKKVGPTKISSCSLFLPLITYFFILFSAGYISESLWIDSFSVCCSGSGSVLFQSCLLPLLPSRILNAPYFHRGICKFLSFFLLSANYYYYCHYFL